MLEKYTTGYVTTKDGRKIPLVELNQISDECWNELARKQREMKILINK